MILLHLPKFVIFPPEMVPLSNYISLAFPDHNIICSHVQCSTVCLTSPCLLLLHFYWKTSKIFVKNCARDQENTWALLDYWLGGMHELHSLYKNMLNMELNKTEFHDDSTQSLSWNLKGYKITGAEEAANPPSTKESTVLSMSNPWFTCFWRTW